MKSIVKVLNDKVQNGDAKNIVDALKQIDPNADGNTIAEVLENMDLGGGGGGGFGEASLSITNNAGEALFICNIVDGLWTEIANMGNVETSWTIGSLNGTYSAFIFIPEILADNLIADVTNGSSFGFSNSHYGKYNYIFAISCDGDITQEEIEIEFRQDGGIA